MANTANTIQIKRSGNAGSPQNLKLGELAYSYLAATGNPNNNGGDSLFIGTGGVNVSTGYANNITVIGGKYFTDLLGAAQGTLSANHAILTDSSSKLDRLLTTNLAIGGTTGAGLDQTISVTNANGNLVLKANGTGLVTIDGTYGLVLPVGTSSNRGTGVQGEVRYNTTITGFEGYNGSNWSSLGGVRSVDGNAYIIAETSPGAGDDTLHFYAGTSGSPGTSISVADWSTTTLTVKTILTATTANNDVNLGASTGTGVTTINSGALGSLDHITIGGTTPAAGSFTGFTVNATGSTFTVNPATIGSLDNITIGATTKAAGSFTSVTDGGLTETRVTFAGVNGLLSDNANLTYASGTFTIADATASSDTASGALVVTGGVGIGGDLHVTGNIVGSSNSSGQFYGDQYGFNALYAGYDTFTQLPNTPLQVTANKNDYAQINFQNYNNGNIASTDYVATADNGSNYTGFIDMGIASGTYDGTQTGVLGPVVTANDGYLYVTGDTVTNVDGTPGVGVGNLVIGTTSENSQVKIVVASGSTSTHPSVVFNPYNTASTDTTSGTLIVTGGVGISGDLQVGGLINAASATFSSINSTPIGNTTPSTGAFTTLTVDNTTGNNVTLNPATTGTIDNITIGGTTPAAGTFTGFTVNASGSTFTVAPATAGTLDNVAIGGTTAAAAHFTDLYTTNVSATEVVFGGTSGVLQSDSGLTYGSGTLTVSTEVDVGNLKLSGTAVSSTSSSGSVNINTSPDGMTVHNWEFNTDGTTAFNNAAYTFPSAGSGNAQYILADTTGNGTLAWTSTTLTIHGDTSSTSTLQLLSQALTFAGGTTPITVTVSDQTVTVNIADATYSTLGLASFDTTYFTVTAGNATITASSIGNDRLANSTISGINLGSNLDDLTVGTNLNFTSTDPTYNGGTAQTINLDNEITLTTVNADTVNSTTVNAGDLSLSGSTIENSSTTGDVVLVANNGGSDKTYTFGGDGNLNVAGKITNVSTPTDDYDAANKMYVDSVAQGLHIHDPAQVATNDALAVLSGGSITYANGTSGVGATITLSTPLTMIDNYTLQDNDRILVKNESTTSQNGVYVWTTGGTVLTRATDFDKPVDITGGDFVFVEHGTAGGSTGWVQTDQTLASVGSDAVTFKQFAGAGTYVAGAGLNLSGNSFSVNAGYGLDTSGTGNALELASTVAGNGLSYSAGVITVGGTTDRITVNTHSIDIASTYAGQSSITTLGTVTTGTWNATAIDATHGGTGQTTWAKGDLLYASDVNTLTKLNAGTNGQVIQLQDGLPVWGDLDGGTYS